MPLTLNQSKFDDDLINPLIHNIEEEYFISTKQSEMEVESENDQQCKECDFSLKIRFFMSGWIKIE